MEGLEFVPGTTQGAWQWTWDWGTLSTYYLSARRPLVKWLGISSRGFHPKQLTGHVGKVSTSRNFLPNSILLWNFLCTLKNGDEKTLKQNEYSSKLAVIIWILRISYFAINDDRTVQFHVWLGIEHISGTSLEHHEVSNHTRLECLFNSLFRLTTATSTNPLCGNSTVT